MRSCLRLVFAVLTATLAACASSSRVLTGTPRLAIAAANVRVYTQAPKSFEEIAVLRASRESFSSAGGERVIAKMIEAMRAQAAELGANGLLLEDFFDSDPIAIGTRVGTQSYSHNASIDVGLAVSLGFAKKMARSRAIFVQSEHPGA